MTKKPKVAFICVHNSCRSQMAEALARRFAADAMESYSAGTELKASIDSGAVQTIKPHYGIDMAERQYPKLLAELPVIDIVVTMGCNVQCPAVPCRSREDWGLEDPSGKGEAAYLATAREIEAKLESLKHRICAGEM